MTLSAAGSAAPPTAETPRARVPLWDNARFIAITLVVAGHAITRLTGESDAALVVYLLIFSFHMPLFALISGYFSRSGAPTSAQLRRVLTDIIAPYLIFETIWTIVHIVVEGRVNPNPTTASWTLWFLLALGIFRLVLPYLSQLRWPLAWAVLLLVLVGYWPNVDITFSLSRALGILPFFVLGWQLKEWGVAEKWREATSHTTLVRIVAAGILTAWAAVLIVGIDYWRAVDLRLWFFYVDSYDSLGFGGPEAVPIRLALLALAVLLSMCVFVLVPRGQTWMSAFGQATMYVYLLHTFVLYPFRESGLIGGDNASPWLLTALLLASIPLTVVLASRPVQWLARPLIQPRLTWLLGRERSPSP